MRGKCLCIQSYDPFIKGKVYEYTDKEFVFRNFSKGYNVCFFNGEYLFFRKNREIDSSQILGHGVFELYFKTFNEIRKEKINKINGK